MQNTTSNNSARKSAVVTTPSHFRQIVATPGIVLVEGGFFESQFSTSLNNLGNQQSQNQLLVSMSDIQQDASSMAKAELHKIHQNISGGPFLQPEICVSPSHQNTEEQRINALRKISGNSADEQIRIDNQRMPQQPVMIKQRSLKVEENKNLLITKTNTAETNLNDTSKNISKNQLSNVQGLSRDQGLNNINVQSSFNNDLAYPNPYPQVNPQVVVQLMGKTLKDTSSQFNIFSNSFDESGALHLESKPPQRNCKSSTRKLNPTSAAPIMAGGHQRQVGLGAVNYHSNQISGTGGGVSHQIPLLQNLGGLNNSLINNAPLTAKITTSGPTNLGNLVAQSKKGAQQFQQNMMTQLHQQRSSGNPVSQIDNLSNAQIQISQSSNISQHDLSNRSHLVNSSGGAHQSPYGSSYNVIQGQGNSIAAIANGSQNFAQQPAMILSAGGPMKRNSANMNTSQQQQIQNQMDPQAFFKMKQQKYKSSRSNNPTATGYGGGIMATGNPGPFMGANQQTAGYGSNHLPNNSLMQFQRQCSNSKMIENPQQIAFSSGNMNQPGAPISTSQLPFKPHIQRNKGNKTQKNNKSICSSTGGGNASIINTSSTGFTGGKFINSLDEATQPEQLINLCFADRKVQELQGIARFKSLKELDISGNLLNQDIPELRHLQFLIKLNLSNNQISTLYSLPSKIENLNLSYNKLKQLNPESTKSLKNIRCLDVSCNQLETLDGIENMDNLKRLLAKNNQVQDLASLNSLKNLIEIDLENNQVENYIKLLDMVENKKDMLVLNLKFTPLVNSINSYDQLCHEFETSFLMERSQNLESQESGRKSQSSSNIIDRFKKRLSHFDKGILYRSQRVFLKLQKAMLQNSKRSSSNFSNGSSSQGRVYNSSSGVHTGGRGAKNHHGNTSVGNSYSPLLNTTGGNLMNTPNHHQHSATHRQDDMQQLFDNILEEEDRLKMKRKKKNDSGAESQDFEESLYLEDEDELDYEDGMHPMLFDDDMEDLQSYRNHQNNGQEEDEETDRMGQTNKEFLNESTADFGGVLKEITKEIRDELGVEQSNHLLGAANPTSSHQQPSIIPEHLQSFQSTQSLLNNNKHSPNESGSQVNTHKKNPIFKLDLSKCTNNQSEDDEDEDHDEETFAGGIYDEIQDQEVLFENIRVTDDSFRQFQKNNVHLNSVGSLHQIPGQILPLPALQTHVQQIPHHSLRDQVQVQSTNQFLKSETSSQSTIRTNSNRTHTLPTIPESQQQQVEIIPKQPPKGVNKNVIIPKLQLQVLKQQETIPLRSSGNGNGTTVIQSSMRSSNKQISSSQIDSGARNQQQLPPSTNQGECKRETCRKYKKAIRDIRTSYEAEKESHIQEIARLRGILQEIKEIFKYNSAREDFMSLPQYLRAFKVQSKDECNKALQEVKDLNFKCEELNQWKKDQQSKLNHDQSLVIKCQENEKTISNLKDQLMRLLSSRLIQQNSSSQDLNSSEDLQQLVNQTMPLEIKRTVSAKYNQHQTQVSCLLNNPNYFYNSNSQNTLSNRNATDHSVLTSSNIPTQEAEEDESQMDFQSKAVVRRRQNLQNDNLQSAINSGVASGTTTTRKKSQIQSQVQQQSKGNKRPQSVVTGISARRSSQGIKINSILKNEPSNKVVGNATSNQLPETEISALVNRTNILRDDQSVGANEYCSNQDLMPHLDLSSINALVSGIETKATPLSLTMNGKGNIPYQLQKMKERNSSLQDRHRQIGSFRENSGSHSALNIVQSPTPTQAMNPILNLNKIIFQQDQISNNPYILSPNNHRYNDSLSSVNNFQQQNKGFIGHQNYQSLQISTSNLQPMQPQTLYQNQPQTTSGVLGKQINMGTCQLRKISYSKDQSTGSLGGCNSTRRPSHNVTSSSRISNDGYSSIPLQTQYPQPTQVSHPIANNEYVAPQTNGQINRQIAPQCQSAGTKQHSKTQRIHVNRIQYNQMFGALSGARGGTGFNSSLSKQGDFKILNKAPNQDNSLLNVTGGVAQQLGCGYQTSQNQTSQQINLSQLFSGRLLMRSDSNEHNNQQSVPSDSLKQGAVVSISNFYQSAPQQHNQSAPPKTNHQ